ncbi:hypothetical protein OAU08_01795 [Porticoccaceae bacterium]|nr:hypothetical protein [Porticoccaceae bacterium]
MCSILSKKLTVVGNTLWRAVATFKGSEYTPCKKRGGHLDGYAREIPVEVDIATFAILFCWRKAALGFALNLHGKAQQTD